MTFALCFHFQRTIRLPLLWPCRRAAHHWQGLSNPLFVIAPEISCALHEGKPVVALESALITHGLASPDNLRVAQNLEAIVRKEGAVPATVALLDGRVQVGLSRQQLERLAQPNNSAMKVSRRDLANCLVQKRPGGTTVAATMWAAHQVGIKVFGTGGIGGVHRGAEQSFDISADLVELGRTPVAVVCAGVKSILDIGKTLEFLETQGVNVLVLDKQPHFPGFFSPRTKFRAPHCTESLDEVADILVYAERLGLKSGTVVACPMPGEHSALGQRIEEAIQVSLANAQNERIVGKEVTPFVLCQLGQLTGQESVRLNILLLENNARMAARLAVLYAKKLTNGQFGHLTDGTRKIPSSASSVNAVSSISRTASKSHEKKCSKVCIGAAIVDFEVLPSSAEDSSNSGAYLSAKIMQRPGGVARNHADALTRLGCDVQLVSALGTDAQGRLDPGALFLMQRGAHIDWSHVKQCKDQPTACSVGVALENGSISHGFISVDHMMTRLDTKFLDSKVELIAAADFLVMDANLHVEAIRKVQQLAERSGTKIWFEPTNSLKVPKLFAALGPNPLAKVHAMSPNLAELHEFIINLGSDGTEKAECVQFLEEFIERLSLPSSDSLLDWLSNVKVPSLLCPKSHLLVTCDRRGVLLISRQPDNAKGSITAHFLAPPIIGPNEIVSVSGAGDCFNSGFLAVQLDGFGDEESLGFGRECAKESLKSAEAVPESLNKTMLIR